jgi:protein TonB
MQPIPAAPIASTGSAPSAGAADIRGPGTGSGGQGIGLGSGDSGTGTGGGGGGFPARWLRGSIEDEDYPRREFEAGIGGTVHFRFVVGVNGRVTECRLTRSSGSGALDTTTCALVMKRFRYRPARNAQGRPIPSVIPGEHDWRVIRRPDLVIEEPADDEVRR